MRVLWNLFLKAFTMLDPGQPGTALRHWNRISNSSCSSEMSGKPVRNRREIYIITLKRYPVKSMPLATTPIKVAINFGFNTLRRIAISGSDSAITLIIKARTVPRAAPFPSSAPTMGTIPAALEYIGTPMITAAGTDTRRLCPLLWTSGSQEQTHE